MQNKQNRNGPRVLIAGAGIGGLVLALALLKKGFDVQIFERDLTAIRGEGKYRGPIQVRFYMRVLLCGESSRLPLDLSNKPISSFLCKCKISQVRLSPA